MFPTSVAEAYHESTKYTVENVQKGGGLDWSTEPKSFREFPDAERISLANVTAGQPADDLAKRLGRLGRLLYFTNGITRVLKGPHGRIAMRASPSAGALYPTEIYVASSGYQGLPDGVYNYQVSEHALARLDDRDLKAALRTACADHLAFQDAEITLILTGDFRRSAWRYKDRGYRRVLLDTGHVLGNLVFYARCEEFCAVPIAGFADRPIAEMLKTDVDQEMPLVVVPLVDRAPERRVEMRRRVLRSGPPPRIGDVEEETPSGIFFAPGEGTQSLHRESEISAPTLRNSAPILADVPLEEASESQFELQSGIPLSRACPDFSHDARSVILRRRSCRGFDVSKGIKRRDFEELLHFTYALDKTREAPHGFLDLGLLESYLAISAVEGFDPGLYFYAPRARELRSIETMDPGEPSDEALDDITAEGGMRAKLHFCCLGQELARDAAFVLFHVLDLKKAMRRYGDRAYRYAHLDAGHLGERLNLGAVQLLLGPSGIGGFFDDSCAKLLSLRDSRAIVYITTVGVPRTQST